MLSNKGVPGVKSLQLWISTSEVCSNSTKCPCATWIALSHSGTSCDKEISILTGKVLINNPTMDSKEVDNEALPERPE